MSYKLSEIIRHSVLNVEYYRRLHLCPECKIEEIPLLTKSEIQNNVHSLISDSDLSNLGNLLIKSSSGSSGIPTAVYWSQNGYIQSMRSLWKRRIKFYNISPCSIELNFTNSSINTNNWYSIRKNVISASRIILDDNEKMEQLFYYINHLKVEWIYIQPYVALKAMSFIKNNKISLPKSLRYIEFVGEILSDEIRQNVSELFNVPIANMYGSEEMNGIAYECPQGNMHVLDDNVFIETEYKNEGEIFITSLTNYTMPLLRYKQGDIVELSHETKCKCGYGGLIIKTIFGRTYEIIDLEKCKINPYILISIMEYVNRQTGEYIKQYKFLWNHDTKAIQLYILCSSNVTEIRKNIKEYIVKKLSEISLFIHIEDIIFIEEMPKEFGKYSIIKFVGKEV